VVHAANIQERAGAELVLEKASGRGLPRLEKILADDGCPDRIFLFVKTPYF